MSAKLGLQTVDVGAPQFAMHSIREMGGTGDLVHAINLFEVWFFFFFIFLSDACFKNLFDFQLMRGDVSRSKA